MNPNLILSTVLLLLGEYRKARDRQRALNPTTGMPDDPSTPGREDFLTDAELIAMLRSESQALQVHADEMLVRYRQTPEL